MERELKGNEIHDTHLPRRFEGKAAAAHIGGCTLGPQRIVQQFHLYVRLHAVKPSFVLSDPNFPCRILLLSPSEFMALLMIPWRSAARMAKREDH